MKNIHIVAVVLLIMLLVIMLFIQNWICFASLFPCFWNNLHSTIFLMQLIVAYMGAKIIHAHYAESYYLLATKITE